MRDDTIAAGREAWAKLGSASSFEAWKTIALAVALGRQQAMQAAGCNQAQGPKYGAAFNRWLEENGFRQMPYPVRTACCRLVDHLQEIELWRATTPGGERLDHPQVLVRNWRRAFAPGRAIEPRKTMVRHVVSSVKRGGMVPSPDQDTLRRIATELREGWTTDVYKLALVAYYAVMRPAPPPPNPHRAEVPADAAVHVAA